SGSSIDLSDLEVEYLAESHAGQASKKRPQLAPVRRGPHYGREAESIKQSHQSGGNDDRRS
ncbi:hypothetical protein FRC17_007123, partial [Serendipita sp. 399]